MTPEEKRDAFNKLAIAARDAHSPTDAKRTKKRDDMHSEVDDSWDYLEDTHKAALKLAMDDAMTKVLNEGQVVHRTKHIDKLLDSGRISSLFETGFSAGGDSEAQRALYEEAWFGKGHVPPVYSALEFDNILSSTSTYGSVKIYMKPEVNKRVTVTIGDSLMQSNSMFPGKPGDGETLYGRPTQFAFYVDPAKTREENAAAVYERYKAHVAGSFIEAQIQGGVILEDIEKVYFTQTPSPATTDKLDKLGIPWE